MGTALQRFMNKFEEFKALPSGETFSIEVTDQEATAAAREYITENLAQIKELMKQSSGFNLDVDDPSIRFGNDELSLSAMVGKGFLKTKASLTADIKWNGNLSVIVRSVEVPIVSVSPEELNATAEVPLRQMMEMIGEYAEIRSFELENGAAVLEAVRK